MIQIFLERIYVQQQYITITQSGQPTSVWVFDEHNETQPHNTIQDLKFGMYSLVVWSQTQLRWQINQNTTYKMSITIKSNH